MKGALRKIILFVLIAAAVVVGYMMLSNGSLSFSSSGGGSGLQSTTTGQNVNSVAQNAQNATSSSFSDPQAASNELLSVLLSLNAIELDDSVFANAAFTSLEDFTITITAPQTTGRTNPFSPIGSGVADIDLQIAESFTASDATSTVNAGADTDTQEQDGADQQVVDTPVGEEPTQTQQ